jgi:precorrin-6B methylase 2
MKKNKKMGDNSFKHSFSPYEVFLIKYVNYYWKFIDYLAYGMEKIANLYEKDISKEYEKETNMFNTINSNNIIHIGCGAYPATAITLAKMNCKNIVAIDRNARAVKLANKVITKKNLYNNITIKKGDGRTFPIEKFDTIIISGISTPKIEVLNHIFKTSKPDSKIIIRELCEISEAIENYINSHENIKLIKKIENNSQSDHKWKSFYTVKL